MPNFCWPRRIVSLITQLRTKQWSVNEDKECQLGKVFVYIRNMSLKVRNIDSCTCVISGCRREVQDNCPLLGYYEACSDNSFPTFRIDALSQNVGMELLLFLA